MKLTVSNFKQSDLSLTMYDVFCKVAKELQQAFDWNDDTLKTYTSKMKDLQKFIDPNKSFMELEFTDFNNAVEDQAKEYARMHSNKTYSESSKHSRRTILMQLCKYINSLNVGYIDKLYGCHWKYKKDRIQHLPKDAKRRRERLKREREEDIAEIVVLPKSLTIKAENKLARMLRTKSLNNGGESIGGLLMLYLGLRPGECCAVKYSNIKPIKDNGEYYALYVFEQVDTKDNLKSNLKTKNAYRVLPIPQELMQLIDKRKDWIKTEVNGADINEYPIVNGENDFTQICKRKKFSDYITNCFRNITLEESIITYSNNLLYKDKSIQEAEATAYILRRNFATIMSSVCMMNEDEIQYLMGHDIKNGTKRYEYLTPEVLVILTEKMNKRHLLSPFANNNITIKQNDDFSIKDICNITLVANSTLINQSKNNIYIDIYSDHCDTVTVSAEEMGNTTMIKQPLVEFSNDFRKIPFKNIRRIDISHKYYIAMTSSLKHSKGHSKINNP